MATFGKEEFAARWGGSVADRVAQIYELIADMDVGQIDKAIDVIKQIGSMSPEQRRKLVDLSHQLGR